MSAPRTARAAELIERMTELADCHADTGDDDDSFTRIGRAARRETWLSAVAMLRAELRYIEDDAIDFAIFEGWVTPTQIALGLA